MGPGVWGRWSVDPGTAGIFSDFDGTLGNIVDHPGDARPLPGVTAVLSSLVRRLGVVAVVSGRPVSYLAKHLAAVEGLVISGLYGLESSVVGSNEVQVDPVALEYSDLVENLAQLAEREAPRGVYVERKGLSVGLHVRTAPAARPWMETFAAEHARRSGLCIHTGKASVELRPPVEIDKGTVVVGLSADLGAVAYFGDDLGDLPAFAALATMRSSGRSTWSVAVGGIEAPAELIDAADEVVDGPLGVLAHLSDLASSLA